MTLKDFVEAVNNDCELSMHGYVVGDCPEDDRLIVVTGFPEVYTSFSLSIILESDWEFLRGVALGLVDINPLYHVSRIVGYFSRIENWNKSKLGELEDRRKGNYQVNMDESESVQPVVCDA